MPTIKAIETIYNGVKYRSRLEAQWAAKMDELGIEHVYEPQCYQMGCTWYLPDFYLPDLDMFAEVKGVPDEKAAEKIEKLMKETGKDVVLLLGNGRMQFFSAAFAGYVINKNFGKAPCEYNSYSFNYLIDPDEGRWKPRGEREVIRKEPPKIQEEPEQKQPAETKIKVEIDEKALTALINPSTFKRIWQASMASLKQKKQAYGVLFMNATARYDEELKTVIIKFPIEARFAYSAVRKQEVVDALTDSFAAVCGFAVPFEYQQEQRTEVDE